MKECPHIEKVLSGMRLENKEALEHFLGCLDPGEQLGYWAAMRDDAQKGVACWDVDHHRQLEQRQQQINTYLDRITKARAILEGNT